MHPALVPVAPARTSTGWRIAFAAAAVGIAAPTSGADEDPLQARFYRMIPLAGSASASHSRAPDWRPGSDLALEVTGLAPLSDGSLAVAIRKGEVWLIDGASGPPEDLRFHRFASGLDEPLGLIHRDGAFLTVQRTELTELRDTDGDRTADAYLTRAAGWAVTGNYHGYAYGPEEDGDGNLWITLNLDIGGGDNALPWHGWGMIAKPDGTLEPVCAGMRSPCGLGANARGDMFFTDQQGEWIPTNSLHHLRRGAFYGNPSGLAAIAGAASSPVAPLPIPMDELDGLAYPEALERVPALVPPAVWFPYRRMGQSRTDIVLDDTGGAFGPFAGQLLVGEFTQSRIGRVFLEQVEGEYQGACFPFLRGFPCAVFRLAFAREGALFAGMTNRGWSSIGGGSYGLHRIEWTGETPFEILEMRALHDGFELVFTRPVDPATAGDPTTYAMSSHTYPLHARYGGDEIEREDLSVARASVSADGLRVRLAVPGLRRFFVHELRCPSLRGRDGETLWHPEAFYTLNRVPPPGR